MNRYLGFPIFQKIKVGILLTLVLSLFSFLAPSKELVLAEVNPTDNQPLPQHSHHHNTHHKPTPTLHSIVKKYQQQADKYFDKILKNPQIKSLKSKFEKKDSKENFSKLFIAIQDEIILIKSKFEFETASCSVTFNLTDDDLVIYFTSVIKIYANGTIMKNVDINEAYENYKNKKTFHSKNQIKLAKKVIKEKKKKWTTIENGGVSLFSCRYTPDLASTLTEVSDYNSSNTTTPLILQQMDLMLTSSNVVAISICGAGGNSPSFTPYGGCCNPDHEGNAYGGGGAGGYMLGQFYATVDDFNGYLYDLTEIEISTDTSSSGEILGVTALISYVSNTNENLSITLQVEQGTAGSSTSNSSDNNGTGGAATITYYSSLTFDNLSSFPLFSTLVQETGTDGGPGITNGSNSQTAGQTNGYTSSGAGNQGYENVFGPLAQASGMYLDIEGCAGWGGSTPYPSSNGAGDNSSFTGTVNSGYGSGGSSFPSGTSSSGTQGWFEVLIADIN